MQLPDIDIPAIIRALKDAGEWLLGYAPSPTMGFIAIVGLIALWIWKRKK